MIEKNSESWLRYSQADILSEACVNCHNNLPDSPKSDWQVGDVRGVLAVSFPVSEITATATGVLRDLFFVNYLNSGKYI